ncbi:MAG: leucine-rich repeat domain-containing protein [Bacteroidales bacterium]|jgi:hypothetical protein|nr:leucine-rich repeat domain-containing protein [Bacteroidales bacterium]
MKQIFNLRTRAIALFIVSIAFAQPLFAAIAGAGTLADPWLVGTPNAADVKAYVYGGNELVIKGTGAIYDFSTTTGTSTNPTVKAPWSGNTAITKVSIDDGVTAIGSYSFYNLTKLTSVLLPETLKRIEKGAFYGTSSLATITIPNAVTYIGASAFYGNTKLSTITLPAGIRKIEESTFEGTATLTTIAIPNSVTEIGASAFESSALVGELVIPNSVISIGKKAFADVKIFKLILGTSVESIGESAFEPRSSSSSTLSGELVIPGSVRTIGNNAFKYAKITSLTLGENVQTIGSSAFEGYSASAATLGGALVIPGSVTSIGKSAFKYAKITSLTLSENLTTIGESAFDGATALAGNLSIPTSVQSIGQRAFYGAKNLTGELVIPAGISKIETATFYGCAGLTAISLPEGITEIASSAFDACSGLSGKLLLPSTLVSIGSNAFNDCKKLKGALIIPNKVETINGNAFAGCVGLTSVLLPASITSLNSGNIFLDCTGLKQVINLSPVPQYITATAFKNVDLSNLTLIVPLEAHSAYVAEKLSSTQTNEWSKFGSIKGIVAKPTVAKDLVYTGKSQTGIAVQNTAYYSTIDGNTSAVNAGKYTVTFTLGNKYVWENYTNEPLTLSWSIAQIKIAFEPHSDIVINVDNSTRTLADAAQYLNEGFAWFEPTTALTQGDGQTHTVIYTHPSGNFVPVLGSITVHVRSGEATRISYNSEETALVHAWIRGDEIVIEGLTSGKPYQIYNLSGVLVHSGIAKERIEKLPLPAQAIYILWQGNRSAKIKY